MAINVGIVGMGFMGRTHLAGYRRLKNAKVIAFADTEKEVREGRVTGAGNIGDTSAIFDPRRFKRIYASGLDLIADPEIQIVDICAPTPAHRELFVAACAAGKHVLVEKPMARRPEDVEAMLQSAKRATGKVMVAQCIRFWPEYVRLKQYVTKGPLGPCKSLILRRQGANALWSKWYTQAEISGGALYDLHVHDTDYVNYLFGKPLAVHSVGSSGQTTDSGVDHVVTNYVFPKSAVEAVTAIGAWSQHGKWPFFMGYTAVFEGATLDFDCHRTEPGSLMMYTNKSSKSIKVATTTGWAEQVRYFVNCVARNLDPSACDFTSSALTMKIVQAEERSIQTGRIEAV
ncbi:MAG: Gfo/Idh/MocA family oxidoreductase [Planctomycetota bacterium]